MNRTIQNTVLRANSRDDVLKYLDAAGQFADALLDEMEALSATACDTAASEALSDSGLLGLLPTVQNIRAIAGRLHADLSPAEPAYGVAPFGLPRRQYPQGDAA